MQGTWVRSLVWEDSTCLRATKPPRHNYWACPPEPGSHNYWNPCALEPGRCSMRSAAMRKLSTGNREQPRLATTRGSPHTAIKTQCSQQQISQSLEIPKQINNKELCIAQDFPGGSDGKESACNTGDPGSIPGSGRSPGEGHPLQYSCLENPMDRGA